MTATIVIIILLTILLWLFSDLKLGRKNHLHVVGKREYPMRKSDIELFTHGEELFSDLFTELKNAKKHIHILFYIVKNDKISHDFLTLLAKKAKEGVEVRLLLDRIGSKKVEQPYLDQLIQDGGHFSFCHLPKPPFFFYSLQARNHRKITVIDGRIGYIGGFNVGNEYLGQDPKFGFWRDYHLKLTGEGVKDLQTQFRYDWEDATGITFPKTDNYFPELQQGNTEMKLVPTDGAYLQEHFLELLNSAKKEIIIGSPYFIPGKRIFQTLLDLAHRGINITILLPKKADHMLVKEASFPYIIPLLKSGVSIYHYEKGFYHAKTIMIDMKMCDIGTANFDKRSLYLNHEINCYIYSEQLVHTVREALNEDLSHASIITLQQVKKRSVIHRLKEVIATLISHFL
ncbi:cardiolipin synthase [Bacillus timonensis]|nr:cardiolipin synthase [Bacillus timonensis]